LKKNKKNKKNKKGEIYSWGGNGYGQIGNGNYENQLTPIKIYKI